MNLSVSQLGVALVLGVCAVTAEAKVSIFSRDLLSTMNESDICLSTSLGDQHHAVRVDMEAYREDYEEYIRRRLQLKDAHRAVDGVRLAESTAAPQTMSDAAPSYVSASQKKQRRYWTLPASTIASPTAYGAEWTDVFAAIGFQDRARYNTLVNSTALVGFGVGRADKNVGLEVGIASYGIIRHGLPFTTGGVNFKLHRFIAGPDIAVAAGWDNAIFWGAPDSGTSLFAVVSRHFFLSEDRSKPFSLMFAHLGIGDGRYRGEADVIAGRNAINAFGGIGFRAVDSLNVLLNWDGSDLAAGLSLAPYRNFPFIVSLSLLDFAGRAGDGPRFSVVFSWGDSVLSPRFPVDWFRPDSGKTSSAVTGG